MMLKAIISIKWFAKSNKLISATTTEAQEKFYQMNIRFKKRSFIGNQAGGRSFLFLGTDDFWRDYNEMINGGIEFVREPKEQEYGTVAVFKDLYGNLWDLVEFNEKHPMFKRVK